MTRILITIEEVEDGKIEILCASNMDPEDGKPTTKKEVETLEIVSSEIQKTLKSCDEFKTVEELAV